MARERLISPTPTTADAAAGSDLAPNHALRPQSFQQYVGQENIIERLRIAVTAARSRAEPMEHVLLHGPPGLGKTTLAHVIANEMAAKVHVTNGPALTKGADLVGILTKLAAGDVLFIDEIHRLPAVVEEYLYPAMEDYKVDITLDSGMHARTITMPLPKFTLVGATTRIGLLTAPMRGRFSLPLNLTFYDAASLRTILAANAKLLGVDVDSGALDELSRRSRGTPRVANRLLRRVRDYAVVFKHPRVTADVCAKSLELEGIDARGLDEQDRSYLKTLIDIYSGGPAGIEAIAATMGEEVDTLADVIEPFLLQTALIMRTRQGRRATKTAYDHLGLPYTPPPETAPALFDEEP
jgi:Holliday junction DNA helicase RuvB